MKRLRLEHLQSWKVRSGRRPLILRGARQVGKTFLAEEFARKSGLDPVVLDFELEPGLSSLFEVPGTRELLRNLSFRAGRDLEPGRSLLILDEIQAAPRAFRMLRYLYEQVPDLHVLATGSLLELMLGAGSISVPVGRVEFMHLGPMTFEEFVMARGNESLARRLREFELDDSMPEALHEQILDMLREYLVLGGMPAAVREVTNSDSLIAAEGIKRALLRAFEDDFGKYGGRVDTNRLRKVFRGAPALTGQVLKYTRLDPEDRVERLRASFDLLVQARLLHRVHASDCNGVPLGAEVDSRKFKLLHLDVGLLATACGLALPDLLSARELDHVQSGGVAEQFVGQELLSSLPPDVDPELHYWSRTAPGSTAEVDFVIPVGAQLVPIEVKAGKTGSLRSLHQFMKEKRARVAIRLDSRPPSLLDVEHTLPDGTSITFRLLSLPLYLAGQTRRLARDLVLQDAKPGRARRRSGTR